MSAFVRTAWAVVLARTSGVDDVLFGATVSGRPTELEAIAGPPIREGRARGIDVSATETLRDQVAQKAALVLSGQR